MAVDMNTGEIVIFDETTPHKYIPDAVVGSASIPVAFPPTHIDGKTLSDGGVFAHSDVSESIIKCRESGFEDKDIIVDVILCFDVVVKSRSGL
jgi:predicted acylesterase/phospholipase RssA